MGGERVFKRAFTSSEPRAMERLSTPYKYLSGDNKGNRSRVELGRSCSKSLQILRSKILKSGGTKIGAKGPLRHYENQQTS